MPKLNERGAAHLLVLLILIVGLIAGVYLVVTGNLKLFSHASNPPIVFKSITGQALPLNSSGIPQSTSPSVIVELTSTLGPPVSVSGPISGPNQTGTVSYRTALNPTDLDRAVFTSYLKEPTVYNSTFPNTAGTQFLWVDFKAADGRIDRRSAQIEILSALPTPPPTVTPSPSSNRADLIPTALSAPATAKAAHLVPVTWTVLNQGGKEAVHTKTTSAWEDRVFLSSDQTWDNGDTYLGKFSQPGPVAAGSSYTATVNGPLSSKVSGAYYLILRVDNWNDVAESDNNNNQRVIPINIQPVPTTSNAKRVFVTSTTYNGNLGGLAGADAKCQERANAASLGGTWKAWLSDSRTSAASRLAHNNNPYSLMNGTIVANNWSDLTDGALQNPININELKQVLSGGVFYSKAWTNTTTNGSVADANSSCSNWTSGSYQTGNGLAGIFTYKDLQWTSDGSDPCSVTNTNHLYCFEQ